MEDHGWEPDSVIARGPFVARHYHQSMGVHSTRVWCELEVNGERYQPFNADFECSLGPVPQPPAATLSVEDGSERGLYLLRMQNEQPVLIKLGDDPNFNGFWTSDGREYVHSGRTFSTVTGERRELPPYPGHFLCFSPDRQSIVSFSYEPPSPEITLHQVDLTSGAKEPITVKREDQPWLADSSHLLPGTFESSHIWQAAHLSWHKAVDGRYRLALSHGRTGD